MISEVDIRDWEKVDFQSIKRELTREDKFNDFVYEFHDVVNSFVKQIELIRDKQIKASQQSVAALFRKSE